jgi:hypothetical protein
MLDLQVALKKQLTANSEGQTFTFATPADQIIFKFKARRTVTTKRGEPADLIDCEVLAGEKIDLNTRKTVPVQPGQYVFFLSTQLKRLFDEDHPNMGDVIRVRLCEIRESNRLKLFGYEVLERVTDNGSSEGH